jgi:hypothetical protein
MPGHENIQPKERTMPHLRDITDPDRWPMTWALSVALADPTDHDSFVELIGAQCQAAERLECSIEAFGLEATPLTTEDCHWYRQRAGHEMGDLGYGTYSYAEFRRDSDALRA